MKQPKPYPNDELNEPEDELTRLRRENEHYRTDNIYKLFFSMSRKAGEISDSLNEWELQLDGDDKTFDRFIKLVEKIEPFTKTLMALRQDYLKIPEDELEAVKNNIPRIEQLAQKKKK